MTEEQIITVEPVAVTSEPVTPVKSRGASPLLWLLTLISLFVAILSLLPWFVPQIGAHLPLTTYLAAMQLQKLETVAAVIPTPAPVAAEQPASVPEVDVSAITARFDSLQAQLLTVNNAVNAQSERLDAQQQMAEAIKNQSVSAALNAMQPLLALQSIRAKIENGSAYRAELDGLQQVITDAERPALDKLASGGTAVTAIAADVEKQARQLAAAYREAMAMTWWEKIKARLSGLIYIKAAGTDDPVMAGIRKLAEHIRRGDDAAARATLQALPDSVKSMLVDTDAQLTAREQAIDALEAIGNRLTTASAQ